MPKPNSTWTHKKMKDYIRTHKLNKGEVKLSLNVGDTIKALKKIGHWENVKVKTKAPYLMTPAERKAHKASIAKKKPHTLAKPRPIGSVAKPTKKAKVTMGKIYESPSIIATLKTWLKKSEENDDEIFVIIKNDDRFFRLLRIEKRGLMLQDATGGGQELSDVPPTRVIGGAKTEFEGEDIIGRVGKRFKLEPPEDDDDY